MAVLHHQTGAYTRWKRLEINNTLLDLFFWRESVFSDFMKFKENSKVISQIFTLILATIWEPGSKELA